ncbi:P-loop containing nucleoside triphosphate hydrolase [Pseudocohnilembus persalinus]|uniref:Adenylate kinase isoenzyme 6 homolog n=1 Tax=Pseudocohnilembus persalinus TaxID=266149 RepID=A0A0V0R1F3_PSEPJ|nr:P-loop containing nucleoside triphosphate hydrolase [Pseudocohnilembus persalinus]|eukprot:KRX08112.1 P-loop containing nucleoside triphosphate hydrolase [Pseudocohnilembus persalinus]
MELEEGDQIPQQQLRTKPNILVTGTPGVGKTTFCQLLEGTIENLEHINIGKYVHEKKLYVDWNTDFDVPEFDVDKVCDYFEPIMQQGGKIVDFHSCDFFPERWFDMVILLRCDNTNLFDRLQARNYTQKKIQENIECEILEVTSQEVFESYNKDIIVELQNSKQEDMEKNLNIVIEGLKKWKQLQDEKIAQQKQKQKHIKMNKLIRKSLKGLIKNQCRNDEEYKSLVGKAIDYLQTGERKNQIAPKFRSKDFLDDEVLPIDRKKIDPRNRITLSVEEDIIVFEDQQKQIGDMERIRMKNIDKVLQTDTYFHETKPYEERIDTEHIMERSIVKQSQKSGRNLMQRI